MPDDAEMSLIFVDRDTITDLNERFLGGTGPTDVLAFPIDDDLVPAGRQPDQGGRGPGAPAEAGEPPIVLGDVVVCPTVAARAGARSTASRSTTSSRCSSCTACCTCSNYDHAEPERGRGDADAASASCSAGSGELGEPTPEPPRGGPDR